MLRSTFIHIPGIGHTTEEAIWRNGILSWQDYLDKEGLLNLPLGKQHLLSQHIHTSISEYENHNHSFFSSALPQKEHWRAFPDFNNIAFLDIETTGLSHYSSQITLIGLYDGKESKFFIEGKNLQDFQDEIKNYSTLITFNGRQFDIPFIAAKFPTINFDQFHIDLRYDLAKLGLRGGLKSIERQLGLERDEEIQGIDGFEAVRLWRRYQRGDKEALNTLISYNKADIENLKYLMEFSFPLLKQRLPLPKDEPL
jgi:uncharacterized protein